MPKIIVECGSALKERWEYFLKKSGSDAEMSLILLLDIYETVRDRVGIMDVYRFLEEEKRR